VRLPKLPPSRRSPSASRPSRPAPNRALRSPLPRRSLGGIRAARLAFRAHTRHALRVTSGVTARRSPPRPLPPCASPYLRYRRPLAVAAPPLPSHPSVSRASRLAPARVLRLTTPQAQPGPELCGAPRFPCSPALGAQFPPLRSALPTPVAPPVERPPFPSPRSRYEPRLTTPGRSPQPLSAHFSSCAVPATTPREAIPQAIAQQRRCPSSVPQSLRPLRAAPSARTPCRRPLGRRRSYPPVPSQLLSHFATCPA
jgi:hypothetical protein